jgi:hypothetical protein
MVQESTAVSLSLSTPPTVAISHATPRLVDLRTQWYILKGPPVYRLLHPTEQTNEHSPRPSILRSAVHVRSPHSHGQIPSDLSLTHGKPAASITLPRVVPWIMVRRDCNHHHISLPLRLVYPSKHSILNPYEHDYSHPSLILLPTARRHSESFAGSGASGGWLQTRTEGQPRAPLCLGWIFRRDREDH